MRGSAVAEVFRVVVGIAEVIVDQNGGLAGELEAFTAFVAGGQIVEANHVRSGLGEFAESSSAELIVTNSRPRSRQRGNQWARAASVGVRSALRQA